MIVLPQFNEGQQCYRVTMLIMNEYGSNKNYCNSTKYVSIHPQDELIRQVTVGCIEQGLLLFQVRNELRMTIGLYRRAYESAIGYGLSKALEAGLELEESLFKISQLEAAIAQSTLLSENSNGGGGLLAGTKFKSAPPVTLRDEVDQADRLKEYYESELAKRDEIIVQQRIVIKTLTQK